MEKNEQNDEGREIYEFLRTKNEYETIDELAERTRLNKSWWYMQCQKIGPNSVPRIKAGKYLLFIPQEVDKWLLEQNNPERFMYGSQKKLTF